MQFLQSVRDFPQMVKLGDKMPTFGFNRFKQGLQFVPVDDEGFTLRGDKQRVEYKGRRRSHRFTILGDSSFEYDCILNKEPDSNVIRLRIEGADKYDFFRQPDFVEDPFLQGSYAVYKKVTLLGEGTGKLCHINRPEIIDAKGRRCWGALDVSGDELLITIPDDWLGEASYPVVVDPVIGTNTQGSLWRYYEGKDWVSLDCMDNIFLNKVIIPENIKDVGTFYYYKPGDFSGQRITRAYPCMYNDVNNLPNTKISVNEVQIVDKFNQYAGGWEQAGFRKNCLISAGDYIWFGVTGKYLYFYFDYGGILEKVDIYNSFLHNNIVLPEYVGDSYYSPLITTEAQREFKISMYFTYEVLPNNYVKKLVQTVRVNDNENRIVEFKRKCTETSKILTAISKAQTLFRNCVITAGNSMAVNGSRFIEKFCSVINTVKTDTIILIKIEYKRKCTQTIKIITEISKAQSFFRQCLINAGNIMWLNGVRTFENFCSVIDNLLTETRLYIQVEYKRKCTQAIKVVSVVSKVQSFFRNCLIIASNSMNIKGFLSKRFNTKITDGVKAEGIVKRKLSVFLKVLTNLVVRGIANKRFLNAKVEITLKSRIGETNRKN